MLYRLSILLLLLAVLNQTFSTVGTLVAFQMNRQYISDMLCINRDRPDLHCNGQCVLMQRIENEVDKASEKGQNMLRNLIERDITVFFEKWDFTIQKPTKTPPQYKPLLNVAYLNRKPQSCHTDIFHPPAIG